MITYSALSFFLFFFDKDKMRAKGKYFKSLHNKIITMGRLLETYDDHNDENEI